MRSLHGFAATLAFATALLGAEGQLHAQVRGSPIQYTKEGVVVPDGTFQGLRAPQLESEGLLFGGFAIFPSVAAEGAYDSNVFSESENESPQGAPFVRLSPGVSISNPRPDILAATVGGGVDFRLFLSDDEKVRSLGNVSGRADVILTAFPRETFNITVIDSYRRSVNAPNSDISVAYASNTNQVGAKFAFRPRSALFDLSLRYAWAVDIYDAQDVPDTAYGSMSKEDYDARFDSTRHMLQAYSSWKFAPSSHLFLDVDQQFFVPAVDDPDIATLTEASPLRAYLGIRGTTATSFGYLVRAGFGHSFHAEGLSYAGPIGLGQLALRLSPWTLFTVGAERSFDIPLNGNFYISHRAFAEIELAFGSRLRIRPSISYARYSYKGYTAQPGSDTYFSEDDREDDVLSGTAVAEIALHKKITAFLNYNVYANLTKFAVIYEEATGIPANEARFVKHEAGLGFLFRY